MAKRLLLTLILLLAAVSFAAAERIEIIKADTDLKVVVEESNDFRTVIR